MTTTLMPPESAAPTATAPAQQAPTTNGYRPVSVAANLLPQEIIESRRARKVRRVVVTVLVVFVLLLGGWYGLASREASAAGRDLNTAEDDVQRVTRQQRDFAALVSAQAQSKAISAQLSALLANDLPWGSLLSSLQGAAPSGVQITDISGSLTPDTGSRATSPAAGAASPAGGAQTPAAGAKSPGTAGQKAIGQLTVNGTGTSKPVVAAYLDALTKVHGLANPFLTSSTQENGVERFSVQLDITASALAGRYTAHSGNQSGGR